MSDYGSFWRRSGLVARLRGIRTSGKDRAALLGPVGRFSLSGARCRSSVVEHSIGNGEVDSSILSGSTSFLGQLLAFRCPARSVVAGRHRQPFVLYREPAIALTCRLLDYPSRIWGDQQNAYSGNRGAWRRA